MMNKFDYSLKFHYYLNEMSSCVRGNLYKCGYEKDTATAEEYYIYFKEQF